MQALFSADIDREIRIGESKDRNYPFFVINTLIFLYMFLNFIFSFLLITNSKNIYLIRKNSIIFNHMQKNEYYLDFLTDYKLNKTNYSIYDGKTNYDPDSSEYNHQRHLNSKSVPPPGFHFLLYL